MLLNSNQPHVFRPITTLHEWPKHVADYCVNK